jgi:hypothetical protein
MMEVRPSTDKASALARPNGVAGALHFIPVRAVRWREERSTEENELPQVAKADDGSDILSVALGWMWHSHSYTDATNIDPHP